MINRKTINYILLLILIGLISFISFNFDQNKPLTSLTNIDQNTINSIIIHKDNGNIIIKKIDGQWNMIEPYNIPAHEFRVQSLLALLNANSTSYYNTNDIDLKTYGLIKPRAHIQFNNTHIYFGKSNPVNSMRYVKVNNKMHLLHDELYPLIRSQPTSFVNLALLPQDNKLQKITLPGLEFTKTESGWKSAPKDITSIDQLQKLLQNWNYAKAFSVHAYMKRKSLGLIKIKLDNSKEIQFDITDTDPWLILARNDLKIEYHLDASQKDKLLSVTDL